jgi:hypothetical protein
MSRFAPLVVALVISACASSAPGSDIGARDPTVRLTDGSGSSLHIRPTDAMAVSPMPFSAEAVWNVMASVFDSLGIAVGTLDPKKYVLGNTALKVHGRLGSVPLSRYIDCGQTQGFPSAETYDVHLSVLTQVTPGKEPNTSAIATLVEAAARPMQFKGDYSNCQSRGELEVRIPRVARARLEKK